MFDWEARFESLLHVKSLEGFICALRILINHQNITIPQTYLAGVGRGSSSSFSQGRAAHRTLRSVKPWEAPLGSVHSTISVCGNSRSRGCQQNTWSLRKVSVTHYVLVIILANKKFGILAGGAIALSMTLCGGVLFASWKLLQFPSSCVCDASCNFYSALGPTGQHSWKVSCTHIKRLRIFTLCRFNIAALTSPRTNLSPFTKGCRDRGALMRLINFWRDLFPTK